LPAREASLLRRENLIFHNLSIADHRGQAVEAVVAKIPFGRPGQPEDIARVALFLASDDSAWVTGERITASGGQRA
jgi:NAD(P)-dependent dehydrogenase (short-subunit alcohol dehydrogenase family)